MTRKAKKQEENKEQLLFASTKNSSSDEPLIVDADATEASKTILVSMIDAMRYLHEFLSKGEATVSTRHNTLGIVRNQLKRLEKLLGAEDDLKQDNEQTLVILRHAHAENARLQKQLADGVTFEAIGSKLYLLQRVIYEWWQELGFTYSQFELQPGYNGGATYKGRFTTRIERHISSYEEKPVTARAKIEKKKEELGKELQIHWEDRTDAVVIDNENNRKWITNKFKERFPKSRIHSWESHSTRDEELFTLWHVDAHIDMDDITPMQEIAQLEQKK